MKKLIALMLLLGWGSASAIPVTWTLKDIVLSDGGGLTGSFVFDADAPAECPDYYRDASVPCFYPDFQFQFDIPGIPNLVPPQTISLTNENSYVHYLLYDNGTYLGGGSDPNHLEIFCDTDCSPGTVGQPPGYLSFRILLYFSESLTSSTGPVDVLNTPFPNTQDYFLHSGIETTVPFFANEREIVSGSAVPIPATVWLFGSGLGLLGWIRRRPTA